MKTRKALLFALIIAIASLGLTLTGCKQKSEPTLPEPTEQATEVVEEAAEATEEAADAVKDAAEDMEDAAAEHPTEHPTGEHPQ